MTFPYDAKIITGGGAHQVMNLKKTWIESIDLLKCFRHLLGTKVWRNFILSIALGVFWFFVELTFVFVLQAFLFAIGLISMDKLFLPSWYPHELGWVVVSLLLFGAARAALHMSRTYLMTATQVSFIYSQRAHLLRFGLENPNAQSSNKLIAVFTEVISQASIAIFYLVQLIVLAVSATLFIAACVKIAPGEILIGLFCLGLVAFPLRSSISRINRAGRGIAEEWENVSQTLINGLKNIFFLRVYGLVEKEIQKGLMALQNYRDHYQTYAFVSAVLGGTPLFVGIVIIGGISLLSVNVFHTGSMKLVAFFYLFVRLAQTLSDASQTFSVIRVNWPYTQELLIFQNISAAIVKESAVTPSIRLSGNDNLHLKLQDVDFSYGKNRLLENINFVASKGDILVIKGPSGAGKSTLLALALGQLNPSSGHVLLNEKPLQQIENVNEQFGYVGPEPYLIWGTIRENLLYGQKLNDLSDTDLFEALQKVGLEELIRSMPLQLDEPLFELNDISTGQKQRLAIARAILRLPKILVLDEATANLDEDTEATILTNLKETLREAIVLIVTHKDSFDHLATQTIKIEPRRPVCDTTARSFESSL